MKKHVAIVAFVAAFGGAPVAAATSASNYYVSPRIFIGDGEEIDGTVSNGAKTASQQFTNNGVDTRVSVSLPAGNVKSYLSVAGPGVGAQSLGSFGDTITFSSDAIGKTANVGFRYDGSIAAGAPPANTDSTAALGVFATLWVYRSGSGVSYRDFGADQYDSYKVVGQTDFLYYEPTTSISLLIDKMLSGSFLVGAGSYDVFSSLSLFASTNGNPSRVTLDFSHTGQLGIDAPAGSTYTSTSGVLLSERSAVPEPATWAMFIGGFGLIGATMRRRKGSALQSA